MKHKFKFLFFFILSVSLSSAQVFQWTKQMGSNSLDECNSLAVDPNGNSYVTGWFKDTALFGSDTITSTGGYDIYLAKYNSAGQLQWVEKAGKVASALNNDIGYGVDVDADGNVYVAGTFRDTATFGSITVIASGSFTLNADMFVAKYSPSGTCLWVKTAGSQVQDDQIQAIYVDKNNGFVYVSGYFKSSAAFGSTTLTSAGSSDAFIAKYDTAATGNNPIWVNAIGGTGYDNSWGVTADPSGNPYVFGHFNSNVTFGNTTVTSVGNEDIFLVKYDPSGNFQWVQTAGSNGDDTGVRMTSDASGIYLTGEFEGTISFGSNGVSSYGGVDIFITKYNFSGANQWAQKAGSSYDDHAKAIAADNSGSLYITGGYNDTARFGGNTITSSGGVDIYIAKYDASSGTCQWATSCGGTPVNSWDTDFGYGIGVDAASNIYVSGSFRNTASFGIDTLTSYGITDIFLSKLESLPTKINETTDVDHRLKLFPNPTSGVLYINSDEHFISEINILNIIGQTIYSKNAKDGSIKTVDLSGFEKGVYFCKMISKDNITITEKIIIQ